MNILNERFNRPPSKLLQAMFAGSLMAISLNASAAIIDMTYVGTWDSTGSVNSAPGGPNMAAGQKYVIKFQYDDASPVTNNVDVLNSFFTPSGQLMSTIDLSAAGNSLDIFVPMEGFDGGSPFIYGQNQTNHLPLFAPNPTLNFVNGSDISNPANIIGLEFEGDFVAGAGNFILELFNVSPGTGINMQSLVIDGVTGNAAVTDVNGLAMAVDLVVEAGPDVIYNASNLLQSTASNIAQSNNLGAARSDSENFIDASWSVTGSVSNEDIAVAIENSGLTSTVGTTNWTVNMTEQMTGETDSSSLNVAYLNAVPTANASAVANTADTDFTLTYDDLDLAVNTVIANFEILSFMALVNGTIDATAFFMDLFTGGSANFSNSLLFSQFGAGDHSVTFSISDLANATANSSLNFLVTVPPNNIPEPALASLMLFSLVYILRRRKSMQV